MLQLPFQLFRRQRGYDGMKCLNCQEETKNPKFCSRSCSATYTNTQKPKRLPTEKFCKRCQASLGVITAARAGRRICNGCKTKSVNHLDYDSITKGDFKSNGSANFNSRYPYIRTLSRKWYLASNKPKKCLKCGYDKHIDICHIRDVKDFPDSALIKEINDLSNLVALCKNHHWEFDNGYLQL